MLRVEMICSDGAVSVLWIGSGAHRRNTQWLHCTNSSSIHWPAVVDGTFLQCSVPPASPACQTEMELLLTSHMIHLPRRVDLASSRAHVVSDQYMTQEKTVPRRRGSGLKIRATAALLASAQCITENHVRIYCNIVFTSQRSYTYIKLKRKTFSTPYQPFGEFFFVSSMQRP